MVNRPFRAVLLLILNALTVVSFSQQQYNHNAVIIATKRASSMTQNTKLGRPLLRHSTHHHPRRTCSFLCLQSQQQQHDPIMMSQRYCRHYYANINNSVHQRSIVKAISWPSTSLVENSSHQLRRWHHGTLKSSPHDNNNMDDITRSIHNDSYLVTAVSTTSPNDDDSPQTTAKETQTSPAKESILVDDNGGTAKQWFTYSLPEGYCVGVLSSHNNNINESSSIEQRLLHPEEYKWGMTNLSAASSRTSYYLGRIALRLALQRLLVPHGDGNDDEMVVSSSSRSSMTPSSSSASSSSSRLSTIEQQQSAALNQKTLLYNTISTKPIQKDSHGRPILPEMVVGSISHKVDCAVGLASFHPLFFDSVGGAEQVGSRSVVVDSSVDSEVQWREDCPIYYNDDDESNNRERIGIGVDIEHIDGIRGERIQRKVLTENERSELGGLVEELGISIGEEVMLRFR
eukprot:scaffold4680_cov164-Skeletonema_marinoi.AAC.24